MAAGVHIPYVSTREEAEYAVKSCRYPMEGVRGIASSHRAVCYGMNKSSYYKGANQDIICMIAIETPEGVNNIEEIVKVDGLMAYSSADRSINLNGIYGDATRTQSAGSY